MTTGPEPTSAPSQERSGQPNPAEAVAAPGTDDAATLAELNRLQEERDAAVAALDKRGRQQRRRARMRRVSVGILVAVFAVILPLTTVVTWGHNTVLNTNGWVRTVGPLGSDPAVTAAVSREVTDQLFTAVDAQAQIASALPPKASFLAAPISNGVKGYVQTAVNNVLNSQQFQTLWVEANRFAHEQLVTVLRGDSKALTTTNGEVVLNLVPLLNQALQQVEPFVSGVVGKPVDLPTISGNELPSAACERISAALGRPVPSTCGQIPLFPADKLTQAQRLVRAFDRLTVLLVVLTPVIAGLALWISKRRRRTVMQLAVGGVLGLVVIRRGVWWLQGDLVNTGKPENKAAREAILHQVTHGLFTASGWLIGGLALVFLLALITGPYGWARSMRGYLAEGGRRAWALAVATAGKAGDESTVVWVRTHTGALRIGGVVVAILLMLVFSVSFIGFLVIAALLGLYELWLRRIQTVDQPQVVIDVSGGGAGPDAGESPDGRGAGEEVPVKDATS